MIALVRDTAGIVLARDLPRGTRVNSAGFAVNPDGSLIDAVPAVGFAPVFADPQDGQLLNYDALSGEWVNSSLVTILGEQAGISGGHADTRSDDFLVAINAGGAGELGDISGGGAATGPGDFLVSVNLGGAS